MRITNNMMISNMIRNLGNNQQRLNKYQNQLDTGKVISVPSDDPVVAARALKLRTDVAKVEQYQKNIKDARSWLEQSDQVLKNLGEVVLQRARELSGQAANGTNTPDDLKKIELEMKQLRTQVVHLANSTYAGRYIFSGFKTDQKLINDDESSPDFGKFSIDVSNSEKIFYEIGVGDSINVNAMGGDLFNMKGDAQAGEVPSIIKLFDDVITSMENGKYEEISDKLDTFDAEMGNVLRVRADIGARQNRIDLSEDRMENDLINFTNLMSLNEDADVAEVIMNLKNEENVYRASLAGGARIIQPSLVDFLR